MGERIPCPHCNGEGTVSLLSQARLNVFGRAERMARTMGGVFRLNDRGRAAVRAEAQRLRRTAPMTQGEEKGR